MPDSMVTPNQVAAALFPEDDNWHRVSIVKLVSADFVQVYFTDYGGSCSVHKDRLRLLKHRFLKHPAQALPARFACLEPPPGGWTEGATHRMLQLTAGGKAMLAYIVEIDKDQVIHVCLCDTNGDVDIHIQDVLVDEGHAIFSSAEDSEQSQTVTPQTAQYTSPPEVPQQESPMLDMKPEPATPSRPCVDPELMPDNVAYVSPMQRSLTEEGVEEMYPTAVKFVELTERYSVHIINYEDSPYLLSNEISSFFWDKDLLRSMLRQKRLDIPKKVFARKDNPQLFQDFLDSGLEGITDRDGSQKTHVTGYLLTEVPRILEEFGHMSEDLMSAIEREILNFNPEDPYWKGKFEDQISDIESSSSSSFHLDTKGLDVALKTLQMKRKAIVEKMTVSAITDAADMKKSVEVIEMIERNIAHVQKLMARAKEQEAKSDDEKFILNSISQQYGSGKDVMTTTSTPKNPPGASTTSQTMTNPLDMSSMMNPLLSVMGANAGGMIGMGANPMGMGTDPMANSAMATNPMAAISMMRAVNPMMGMGVGTLTLEQQQFMQQYNMMLRMPGNPLLNPMLNPMGMGMNIPGFGLPVSRGMNMTGVNTNQMSMADMSTVLLGHGRGVPSHLDGSQSSTMPKPGGLPK